MTYSEVQEEIKKVREQLNGLYELEVELREQKREEAREERERQQWLAEFTSRQAHYHSR